MFRMLSIICLIPASLFVSALAQADEPFFGGPMIARGEELAIIQATPLLERPNRPFHFYGNSARRANSRAIASTNQSLLAQPRSVVAPPLSANPTTLRQTNLQPVNLAPFKAAPFKAAPFNAAPFKAQPIRAATPSSVGSRINWPALRR